MTRLEKLWKWDSALRIVTLVLAWAVMLTAVWALVGAVIEGSWFTALLFALLGAASVTDIMRSRRARRARREARALLIEDRAAVWADGYTAGRAIRWDAPRGFRNPYEKSEEGTK